MKCTIKDVARMAEVSVATASCALNNKGNVKPETKKRILEAAAILKYVPNRNAKNLINNKRNTIGLVVTDTTNPYFGMLVNEINEATANQGYNLLLGISNDLVEREVQIVYGFMQDRVDGIVIVPSGCEEYDLKHLFDLQEQGIPIVFSTTYYRGIEADCVMCDLEKGSYEITTKLLETGHRKIFFVGGSRQAVYTNNRLNGYKKAYRDMGIEYSENWIIESTPTFEKAYMLADKILGGKPDAITTVNDVSAMAVLKILKENNIKVPEEISVAGYDDLLYTSILETPLTTVRQPIRDIAEETIAMLIKRINDPEKKVETVLIDPIIKIRETTV